MQGGFGVWAVQEESQVLKAGGVGLQGLTQTEAVARLQSMGRNELRQTENAWWRILLRQFKSSFVYLLLAAGTIAWVLGERVDGATIFLFVLLNAVISFFQEYRSEQTVALLKKYMQPQTRLRRDGREMMVDRTDVVVGDIVLLQAGDMIPADARVLHADGLIVDESAMTGESAAVPKSAQPMSVEPKEPYRASNILFFGTVVTEGSAEAMVFATGSNTVFGDTAELTTRTKRQSAFTQELDHFSRFLLKIVLATLFLLFIVHTVLRHGQIGMFDLLIFAIALAVSVVPEALPMVMTFSLSRGALRLAKKQVIVKRLLAIEDLGGMEVLCTDKTGTLTENRLQVVAMETENEQALLAAAGLCARAKGKADVTHDPFDVAIWNAVHAGDKKEILREVVLEQMPFDPERRRNSVLADGRLVVRGALEMILPACRMNPRERSKLEAWAQAQGTEGHRVLCVAERVWKKTTYEPVDETAELTCLGLIAFVDPIKASARTSVRQAERLGITVKILTGDAPEVARAIARQVGLIGEQDAVLSGEQLAAMTLPERTKAVHAHHVFARVSPRQKFEIIELLKETVRVGFLGEGINDAPALKAANVALVVQSASDIAREAADIILLDRSLQVVVDGIVEGRQVFANTLKYIKATLASNMGNFYALAIASLTINFLPLLPLQILFINLLTDFPMMSVAADTVDVEELGKPQRYHLKEMAIFTTVIGLVSTVFDLVFFIVFLPMGAVTLQTAWFLGSVLTEVVFLFSMRTRLPFWRAKRPAPILLVFTGVAAIVALIAPYTMLGQNTFHFSALTVPLLGIIVLITALEFVSTEAVKLLYYRFAKKLA